MALTLAVAENACEFEHRDLHWGNILVKREESTGNRLECTMNDVDICVDTSGVKVTLIDFTLSRLAKDGAPGAKSSVVYYDLSLDPEIFNGPKGDLQADAYRKMQEEMGRAGTSWEGYLPRTNAIWLEYLASIMLHFKCPNSSRGWKQAEKEALVGFIERARNERESAELLVWDGFFAGCWE